MAELEVENLNLRFGGLAVLEGLWLLTGREVFIGVFNYWKKIFAIVFGMGVFYILRLMHQPPHHGEEGPRTDMPARAAGITPAQAVPATQGQG